MDALVGEERGKRREERGEDSRLSAGLLLSPLSYLLSHA
jgi:hypothetical protein